MRLYEIAENFKNLEALLDREDVPVEMVTEALQQVEGELEDKAENIVKLIKSLQHEANAYKEEEKRLSTNRKYIENKVESLKNYLFDTMKLLQKDKVNTRLFKLSIAKNPPSLNIENPDIVPKKYYVVTKDLDRATIKDILKNGGKVKGCSLKTDESLRIK